jgi:sulfoxide reductase heme-binding subunit YedZ
LTASPLWYVDRSAGEVTLLLMSAVAILGVLRAALPARSPFMVEGLHVNLALMTVVFGGLHVAASILDPYAGLGPVDALIPFLSAYRSTWLGLGVVAGYMFTATILISWPVRRFPRTWWRWLHRLMYGAWVLAVLHSLGTGSDAGNRVFVLLNMVAVAGVLVAFIGLRVSEAWATSPALWSFLAALALVVVFAIAVWAVEGPLQPGWARAAGTPPDLLHSAP